MATASLKTLNRLTVHGRTFEKGIEYEMSHAAAMKLHKTGRFKIDFDEGEVRPAPVEPPVTSTAPSRTRQMVEGDLLPMPGESGSQGAASASSDTEPAKAKITIVKKPKTEAGGSPAETDASKEGAVEI